MAVKLVTQETLTDCGLACVAMVSGQSLATVRKVAIKELGYPKDGPYTTTHENLFKLLAHFGIGHGKKAPFKSLAAMPSLAIMETRKMPSTGNSHLVVFERLPDGDERVLDPGFWLKQQERRDCTQTLPRNPHECWVWFDFSQNVPPNVPPDCEGYPPS